MKQCKVCKKVKPFGEFYSHPATKDKLLSKCKTCAKEQATTVYKKHISNCKECGTKYKLSLGEIKRGRQFCSKDCQHKSWRSGNCPNKGKKLLLITGNKHYAWKENVTYSVIHSWVSRNFGKPKTCEHCKKTFLTSKTIDWANKSGEYKRERGDWLRLCRSCHRYYDFSKPRQIKYKINK